jgi:hypothetical protein
MVDDSHETEAPEEPIEGAEDLPDEVKDGDVAEADEKADETPVTKERTE